MLSRSQPIRLMHPDASPCGNVNLRPDHCDKFLAKLPPRMPDAIYVKYWAPFRDLPLLLSDCIISNGWQEKYLVLRSLFARALHSQQNAETMAESRLEFSSFEAVLNQYQCTPVAQLRNLFSFLDVQKRSSLEETDFVCGMLASSPDARTVIHKGIPAIAPEGMSTTERETGIASITLIRLEMMFRYFDRNDDGYLDREELSHLLFSVLLNIAEDQRAGRLDSDLIAACPSLCLPLGGAFWNVVRPYISPVQLGFTDDTGRVRRVEPKKVMTAITDNETQQPTTAQILTDFLVGGFNLLSNNVAPSKQQASRPQSVKSNSDMKPVATSHSDGSKPIKKAEPLSLPFQAVAYARSFFVGCGSGAPNEPICGFAPDASDDFIVDNNTAAEKHSMKMHTGCSAGLPIKKKEGIMPLENYSDVYPIVLDTTVDTELLNGHGANNRFTSTASHGVSPPRIVQRSSLAETSNPILHPGHVEGSKYLSEHFTIGPKPSETKSFQQNELLPMMHHHTSFASTQQKYHKNYLPQQQQVGFQTTTTSTSIAPLSYKESVDTDTCFPLDQHHVAARKISDIEPGVLDYWRRLLLDKLTEALLSKYDITEERLGMCFAEFVKAIRNNDIPGSELIFRTKKDLASAIKAKEQVRRETSLSEVGAKKKSATTTTSSAARAASQTDCSTRERRKRSSIRKFDTVRSFNGMNELFSRAPIESPKKFPDEIISARNKENHKENSVAKNKKNRKDTLTVERKKLLEREASGREEFQKEQARLKAKKEEEEAMEKERARLKAKKEEEEAMEKERARLKAKKEEEEYNREQARLKAKKEEEEYNREQARLKAKKDEEEREKENARLKTMKEQEEYLKEQARLKAKKEEEEAMEKERARLKELDEQKEREERDKEKARLKAIKDQEDYYAGEQARLKAIEEQEEFDREQARLKAIEDITPSPDDDEASIRCVLDPFSSPFDLSQKAGSAHNDASLSYGISRLEGLRLPYSVVGDSQDSTAAVLNFSQGPFMHLKSDFLTDAEMSAKNQQVQPSSFEGEFFSALSYQRTEKNSVENSQENSIFSARLKAFAELASLHESNLNMARETLAKIKQCKVGWASSSLWQKSRQTRTSTSTSQVSDQENSLCQDDAVFASNAVEQLPYETLVSLCNAVVDIFKAEPYCVHLDQRNTAEKNNNCSSNSPICVLSSPLDDRKTSRSSSGLVDALSGCCFHPAIQNLIQSKTGSASSCVLLLGNFTLATSLTESIELIGVLLALKILYPSQLILLRGPAEDNFVANCYGLAQECVARYGSSEIFHRIFDVFEFLPVCAVVERTVTDGVNYRSEKTLVLTGDIPSSAKAFKKVISQKEDNRCLSDDNAKKLIPSLFLSDVVKRHHQSPSSDQPTRGNLEGTASSRRSSLEPTTHLDLLFARRSSESLLAALRSADDSTEQHRDNDDNNDVGTPVASKAARSEASGHRRQSSSSISSPALPVCFGKKLLATDNRERSENNELLRCCTELIWGRDDMRRFKMIDSSNSVDATANEQRSTKQKLANLETSRKHALFFNRDFVNAIRFSPSCRFSFLCNNGFDCLLRTEANKHRRRSILVFERRKAHSSSSLEHFTADTIYFKESSLNGVEVDDAENSLTKKIEFMFAKQTSFLHNRQNNVEQQRPVARMALRDSGRKSRILLQSLSSSVKRFFSSSKRKLKKISMEREAREENDVGF